MVPTLYSREKALFSFFGEYKKLRRNGRRSSAVYHVLWTLHCSAHSKRNWIKPLSSVLQSDAWEEDMDIAQLWKEHKWTSSTSLADKVNRTHNYFGLLLFSAQLVQRESPGKKQTLSSQFHLLMNGMGWAVLFSFSGAWLSQSCSEEQSEKENSCSGLPPSTKKLYIQKN